MKISMKMALKCKETEIKLYLHRSINMTSLLTLPVISLFPCITFYTFAGELGSDEPIFLQSSSRKKPCLAPPSHWRLSASEVMHNRFLELQKRAAEAAQAVQVGQ